MSQNPEPAETTGEQREEQVDKGKSRLSLIGYMTPTLEDSGVKTQKFPLLWSCPRTGLMRSLQVPQSQVPSVSWAAAKPWD